jgi:conjugal transfer pilus assembly protein TraW
MANIVMIISFLILSGFSLYAKDFGTIGHTFSIKEEDLLDYIKNKLISVQNNELDLLENKFKQHYINMTNQPPVLKIEEAHEYRIYYFDPTIVASKNIYDHHGNLIIEKGSQVNPLTIVSMGEDLLFIDGTNKAHLCWAQQYHPSAKWVLVKGKPLELEENLKRPIYFDQFGFLTHKLNIQHIPARLTQEKSTFKLKIEEIPICKSF